MTKIRKKMRMQTMKIMTRCTWIFLKCSQVGKQLRSLRDLISMSNFLLSLASNRRREDEDSGIESEAEESDDFEDELLEESEEGEDDGQLDKLNAFVDSLVSNNRPSKETEMTTSAPKSTQEGSLPPLMKLTIPESNELAITDILASLTDPSLQSLRKSLAAQQTSKSKSASKKLSAPLAKPIQERLERQAAYEETKNEISKWQNIVKANREVFTRYK